MRVTSPQDPTDLLSDLLEVKPNAEKAIVIIFYLLAGPPHLRGGSLQYIFEADETLLLSLLGLIRLIFESMDILMRS